MNALLKHALHTRANTRTAPKPAIPDYAATLIRRPTTNTSASIPSNTTAHCDTSKAPVQVYTGDKVLGVGVMHKSNSVPIFSREAAIDIATMRRN